jgi:hypothetical protein
MEKSLLKAAQQLGHGSPEWPDWLRGRIEESGVDPEYKDFYPDDVFRRLLGVTVRSYQYWEGQAQLAQEYDTEPTGIMTYPVPYPRMEKVRGRGVMRVYTPEQVAEIAYWFWKRRVDVEESAA